MKPFFGKEIIERPRSGSRDRNPKVRHWGRIICDSSTGEYDYEPRHPNPHRIPRAFDSDWPVYHINGGKRFSDVLGPLKGYLRKSCGRPWNDVYSEMSALLGRAGYALRHILTQHVHVETSTYRGVDGKVWFNGRNGYHIGCADGRWSGFYVEPETGILRHRDRTKRIVPKKPLELIHIDNDRRYEKIDGVWYWFVSETREYTFRNAVTDELVRSNERVVVLKKQLNRRELRNLRSHYAIQ